MRSYNTFLNEFENQGILSRRSSYLSWHFSKGIILNWNYRPGSKAILFDGRSIEELENVLRLTFQPRDLRGLLLAAGMKRTTAIEVVSRVYVSKMFAH